MHVDELDYRHGAYQVEDDLHMLAEVMDYLAFGYEFYALLGERQGGVFGVYREEVCEIFRVDAFYKRVARIYIHHP